MFANMLGYSIHLTRVDLTNTQAYYELELFKDLKSFIVQGANSHHLIFFLTYERTQ